MKIKNHSKTDIPDFYLFELASEDEIDILLKLDPNRPGFREALHDLEIDVEHATQLEGIKPPPGAWEKIESNFQKPVKQETNHKTADSPSRLEIQADYITVSKSWKWGFIAALAIISLFIGMIIYFYLENKAAQQQIQQLKIELKK